ncbi:MAG TPA: acyltransferase family protein [Acidimicrobiales bacterium]|jgi:peptidoglycan/LPS O-acetylase OafA/YrhL|nr:acyltransferase family protein [Acidimicrobiales bacterium]
MPGAHSTPLAPFSSSDPGVTAGRGDRLSALDGIRAFAVLAVLFYHAGITWVGGGLLGVDVFFVLSGFLITSILCREFGRRSTIRLGRFWANRARRLLPALFVLLLGIAAYAHFFAGTIDVASLRQDAISTLLYFSNWHFIFSNQGYFAQAAAPSPLLHTWSLAIEEQYYLIWPLIALFILRRWGPAKLAISAAVGAVASAGAMVWLHAAGSSIDRLYYGTDTRAQALLVGSCLGALTAVVGKGKGGADDFALLPPRWTATSRGRRLWTLPGVCGAVLLVWAYHALSGQDVFLYQGGFLLVALATGGVIVTCVTLPRSALAWVCSRSVLVFIGRISYGLYLYHWPLFLAIDHARTGLSGGWLLAVRLLATFAVAIVSFFLLEEPIRTGRFMRSWRGLASAGTAAVVTAAALLGATIVPATADAVATGSTNLSSTQRTALAAADAFTTHPIRYVIVGDSVAFTLARGMRPGSVTRYGVKVIDNAKIGCDLDRLPVKLSGGIGPGTPGCWYWRTGFANDVRLERPDVVGILLGRWQVSDHLYQGKWMHIGQPIWDRHLEAELNQAIDILSSRGAKITLFTMPYVDPPNEAANGTPFPENDPSRVVAFNRVVRTVAAQRPSLITLVDLNKMIDPNGHFQATIDGMTVRWSDGVHITRAASQWLQPQILPTVGHLGLATRSPINGV